MMHHFRATILQNWPMDAAYIVVPIDIRQEYGVGRMKVEAIFDGVEYHGSVVNMGVRNSLGEVCYIIGIPKAIRQKIGKSFGDEIDVEITPKVS